MATHSRYVSLGLVSLLLSGCANFSAGNLFSHYSAQNKDLYQAVQLGDYAQASDELDDGIAGPILDNMEYGRVYFLDQQYPQSLASLDKADQAVKEQQEQAVISLSQSATSLGSLAINDNLNTYTPPDYELGFLHLYLGLNYLKQGKLEDALVEMRRANAVQKSARERREQELQRAQDKMKSQGISPNIGAVLARYPDAGNTLKAVQNGYLFLLSAILYEADGSLNDAYVDYRRALAVAPNNPAVIDGTLRVAKELGMQQDLVMLKKQYGQPKSLSKSQGRVIILDEQGVVEPLSGWKLSLPLFDRSSGTSLYSIALPYYRHQTDRESESITLNQVTVSNRLLADVNTMASQDLSERLPTIIVRQVLRVVAKDVLRRSTTQGNDLGNLVFNVWNALTEQPDTRSWLTLPARVDASSTVVDAGEQTLQVGAKTYTFKVTPQGTTLVWLSRQGANSTLWYKELGRL
ncbi:hypothetical protein F9817_06345 [Vibrio sp. CAIM 722]|uniref:Lipoprotein n=1 Tax=Vibrio eleionomae TaxID=2653505 RepID=A0A7X4RU29_9VIBR|nr:hypothetical protein [Vibrio eleionomae]